MASPFSRSRPEVDNAVARLARAGEVEVGLRVHGLPPDLVVHRRVLARRRA